MSEQSNFLERLRVASPCPVSWERMEGDERVRFCSQCDLHVYNISELTGDEARALIANAEGRVCARLYRRADGTVLTRDCPVGLRAVRRRVARTAGTALTAIISLFSVSSADGQKSSRKGKQCSTASELVVERSPAKTLAGALAGRVVDPQGATVAGASVTLTNTRTKERLTATTNEMGEFSLNAPAAGDYSFEVSMPGFMPVKIERLRVNANELTRIDVAMQPGDYGETVGILISDPPFGEKGNGTTTFNSKEITSLPHG
jgi:hypothetical protein